MIILKIFTPLMTQFLEKKKIDGNNYINNLRNNLTVSCAKLTLWINKKTNNMMWIYLWERFKYNNITFQYLQYFVIKNHGTKILKGLYTGRDEELQM